MHCPTVTNVSTVHTQASQSRLIFYYCTFHRQDGSPHRVLHYPSHLRSLRFFVVVFTFFHLTRRDVSVLYIVILFWKSARKARKRGLLKPLCLVFEIVYKCRLHIFEKNGDDDIEDDARIEEKIALMSVDPLTIDASHGLPVPSQSGMSSVNNNNYVHADSKTTTLYVYGSTNPTTEAPVYYSQPLSPPKRPTPRSKQKERGCCMTLACCCCVLGQQLMLFVKRYFSDIVIWTKKTFLIIAIVLTVAYT